MIRDGVLADRSVTWLSSEREKRRYFKQRLGEDLRDDEYPRLVFGKRPDVTVRYFPDKLPIGYDRDHRGHVFMYLAPSLPRWTSTVLSVVLRTAVEWGVIARVPCSIKLLKAPKSEASFHDVHDFERLVDAARSEALALLVVLLGGEAGLRCGEIMALDGPRSTSPNGD
jgi:hypothetical protein